MNKRLANIVGAENASENPLDMEAYSYCASESELLPEAIIYPRTTEQIQRVLLFANQSRMPVVIRGSGASLVDGCIGEKAIVLSSERMNKVLSLDLRNKLIEVEAGIRIADLNSSLKALNMIFPLIPFNPIQTSGGMLALNSVTKESHSLGRMNNWVEEVEFVDGTGKSFYTRKKELVIGKEGLSGFITKVRLRITEIPTISLDVFGFDNLPELLGQARLLKKDSEIYFLEFIDKKTAQELGFEVKYALIAGHASLKGKIKSAQDVKSFLEKLDSVHSAIRSKGYYFVQDPAVSLEKAYDLIVWCEKHEVRLHGHMGLGIFYAYFKKKDADLINPFCSFIKRSDGTLGSSFGVGFANKAFVLQEKKKELIRIKDEYDYNNILNADKIIDYR